MIVGRDCVVLGLLAFVVVAVTVMSSSSLLWSLCRGSSCGRRALNVFCRCRSHGCSSWFLCIRCFFVCVASCFHVRVLLIMLCDRRPCRSGPLFLRFCSVCTSLCSRARRLVVCFVLLSSLLFGSIHILKNTLGSTNWCCIVQCPRHNVLPFCVPNACLQRMRVTGIVHALPSCLVHSYLGAEVSSNTFFCICFLHLCVMF